MLVPPAWAYGKRNLVPIAKCWLRRQLLRRQKALMRAMSRNLPGMHQRDGLHRLSFSIQSFQRDVLGIVSSRHASFATARCHGNASISDLRIRSFLKRPDRFGQSSHYHPSTTMWIRRAHRGLCHGSTTYWQTTGHETTVDRGVGVWVS